MPFILIVPSTGLPPSGTSTEVPAGYHRRYCGYHAFHEDWENPETKGYLEKYLQGDARYPLRKG